MGAREASRSSRLAQRWWVALAAVTVAAILIAAAYLVSRQQVSHLVSSTIAMSPPEHAVCKGDVSEGCAQAAARLAGLPVAWIDSPSNAEPLFLSGYKGNAIQALSASHEVRVALISSDEPQETLGNPEPVALGFDPGKATISSSGSGLSGAETAIVWSTGRHEYYKLSVFSIRLQASAGATQETRSLALALLGDVQMT